MNTKFKMIQVQGVMSASKGMGFKLIAYMLPSLKWKLGWRVTVL